MSDNPQPDAESSIPASTISQPPTTSAPSQSAPIPGHRAAAFQELYSKTLTKTLSIMTYQNFATCFPTIAASPMAGSLKHIHEQFVKRLEEFARDEFARICELRRVVEGLNGLEEMIRDAKRRRDAGEAKVVAAHLLPPNELVAAHMAPQYAQQQSQLNAKLQTTQAQNAKLFERIQTQQKEIQALVAGFQGYIRDLEGAVEKLNGQDGELRKEIREVDQIMSGV